MKLSIVVLTPGPAEGKVIPINVPQFVVGRDPDCQLRPTSLHISKRHCALLRREDKVFVRDFDSMNGTFINDRQIKGEIELRDGDKLRVGPLTFGVRLEAAVVDRPAPLPTPKATAPKPPSGPTASSPAQEPSRSVSEEDEAAATLLAMQDTDAPGASSPSEVPEGSTVHDLPLPIIAEMVANKEKEKPKQSAGDTSTAAKSILDKYIKRPRPT
ncbi:MAG TPA: FHA domain-containing protein [Gemmataceae bacterium]|jgi:pSer/pThr/pTyr-binding forkhead associated (FHA) protein